MDSAAGVSGKPGIRIISPVIGTINPAPAAISISRTVKVKSLGRPIKSGLSDNDFCVFAIQTGNLFKPRLLIRLISDFASTEYSTCFAP